MPKMVKIVGVALIVVITVFLVVLNRLDAVMIDKDMDKIVIEAVFDEPENNYTNIADAADEIYKRQLILCDAYAQSYSKFNYDIFKEKYPSAKAAKLRAKITEKRKIVDTQITDQFVENMASLLKNVQDLENREEYVKKMRKEALEFYIDYFNIKKNNDKTQSAICATLIKYINSDNTLAYRFLKENKETVINACVLQIEDNAKQRYDLRSYMAKNNQIIKALNDIYGGTSDEIANRVNSANRKLANSLINSLETISEKERNELLESIR